MDARSTAGRSPRRLGLSKGSERGGIQAPLPARKTEGLPGPVPDREAPRTQRTGPTAPARGPWTNPGVRCPGPLHAKGSRQSSAGSPRARERPNAAPQRRWSSVQSDGSPWTSAWEPSAVIWTLAVPSRNSGMESRPHRSGRCGDIRSVRRGTCGSRPRVDRTSSSGVAAAHACGEHDDGYGSGG